jgi:hypothetical protein
MKMPAMAVGGTGHRASDAFANVLSIEAGRAGIVVSRCPLGERVLVGRLGVCCGAGGGDVRWGNGFEIGC